MSHEWIERDNEGTAATGEGGRERERERDREGERESNGHQQKKEQREPTQVQRLCVARLLKRWLRKQPEAGSTAQKGVQQQKKDEVWG